MSVNDYDHFCTYCGYPDEVHPVEHAELREKEGILCEEPQYE